VQPAYCAALIPKTARAPQQLQHQLLIALAIAAALKPAQQAAGAHTPLVMHPAVVSPCCMLL
jgi:hypothetical protein